MEAPPNAIRVKLVKRLDSGLGVLLKERTVKVGDIILKVNDISVAKMAYETALDILESIPPQTPVVLFLRGPDGFATHLETVFQENGCPRTRRITCRSPSRGSPRLLPKLPTADLAGLPTPSDSPADSPARGPAPGQERVMNGQLDSPQITVTSQTEHQGRRDAAGQQAVSVMMNDTVHVHQEKDMLTVVVNSSPTDGPEGAGDAPMPRRASLALVPVIKDGELSGLERSSPRSRRGSNLTLSGSPKRFQKLTNVENTELVFSDTLHQKAVQDLACTQNKCVGSLLSPTGMYPTEPRVTGSRLAHAKDFCDQFYASLKK